MQPLTRRLLVPALLLFAVLAVGTVAVGAWTNDEVVVVPAQAGDDGGVADAMIDAAPMDAPMFGDGSIFSDSQPFP
jgi:hypothetical protein